MILRCDVCHRRVKRDAIDDDASALRRHRVVYGCRAEPERAAPSKPRKRKPASTPTVREPATVPASPSPVGGETREPAAAPNPTRNPYTDIQTGLTPILGEGPVGQVWWTFPCPVLGPVASRHEWRLLLEANERDARILSDELAANAGMVDELGETALEVHFVTTRESA